MARPVSRLSTTGSMPSAKLSTANLRALAISSSARRRAFCTLQPWRAGTGRPARRSWPAAWPVRPEGLAQCFFAGGGRGFQFFGTRFARQRGRGFRLDGIGHAGVAMDKGWLRGGNWGAGPCFKALAAKKRRTFGGDGRPFRCRAPACGNGGRAGRFGRGRLPAVSAGRPTTGQPLTPSSSTSNFREALGGITPPAPRAP
jgi:hypothetical protein